MATKFVDAFKRMRQILNMESSTCRNVERNQLFKLKKEKKNRGKLSFVQSRMEFYAKTNRLDGVKDRRQIRIRLPSCKLKFLLLLSEVRHHNCVGDFKIDSFTDFQTRINLFRERI